MMPEAKDYIWWFPGCPLRIHLELNVVERLQRRFEELGSIPDQGLLFGSALGGTVTILDFTPLPCGGTLDPGDAIAALVQKPGPGLLVGYYRTEKKGPLRLSDADLALADTLFKEPYHIFLLAQTGSPEPATAGFFFRDGGRMQGDVSFLEFPFDACLLPGASRPIREPPQSPIPEATGPATVPVPAPIAPTTGRPRYRRTAWALCTICLLALATAAIAWLFPRPRIQVERLTSVLPHQSSLGLQIEMSNGALRVTWDRNSDVIANAQSGMLVIKDGGASRELPLDSDEVRAAGILYSPASDRVQFQLTVFGQKTATELVMAVLPNLPRTRSPSIVSVAQPSEAAGRGAVSAPVPHIIRPSRPFAVSSPLKNNEPPAKITEPPALRSQPEIAGERVRDLLRQATSPPAVVPFPGTSAPRSADTPEPQAAYSPAIALNSVPPQFPSELRSVLTGPRTVEIEVSIDAAGRVVRVTPLSQKGAHQLLVWASVSAAWRWKFRPAERDGKPVPSVMILRFNFNPRP